MPAGAIEARLPLLRPERRVRFQCQLVRLRPALSRGVAHGPGFQCQLVRLRPGGGWLEMSPADFFQCQLVRLRQGEVVSFDKALGTFNASWCD